MALKTLAELRSNIGSTVRETQVNSLIDTYINVTLAEIHNTFPWTWLRKKQTFATVASQEAYSLDEEVDRVAILRQLTTPQRLIHLPDDLFYKLIPNPESLATGNPVYYRLWDETGFSTNLAADDTVYVNSSSTSDGSSFTVSIVGRNTSGLVISEVITLNGTTNVTSTNSFQSNGLMQVSKSAKTTGTVTVYRSTGGTVLANIAPEETAPRFKRLSLYPIPSSAITMYLEYYERLRLLVNDADVPQLDHKWLWVVREGALARMWEYKQNETASAQHYQIFLRGLELMKQDNGANLDYIPVMQARLSERSTLIKTNDTLGYALQF